MEVGEGGKGGGGGGSHAETCLAGSYLQLSLLISQQGRERGPGQSGHDAALDGGAATEGQILQAPDGIEAQLCVHAAGKTDQLLHAASLH